MSRAVMVAAAALGGASCDSGSVPAPHYGTPVITHPDSGAGGAAGAVTDPKDGGTSS
jgi:hypothetical protein